MLERLTQDIIEAARLGQWDQVIALYDQRESQGLPQSLSTEAIQFIAESDQWLTTRVREAQAAIKLSLLDIQDQQRKLAILQQQWGETQTTPVRHLLTI